MSIANSTGLLAAYMTPEAARAVWEIRAVRSRGARPTSARAGGAGDGYRVTGRWDFASGCRHSKWMGAHGPVVEPDGSLRRYPDGRTVLRTWLFPAEQARLLDNWNPIGLRGTASESYEIEDMFVPAEFSSTREDPNARLERGRLYAFPQQTLYSVGIASVALGIARGMLDAFIELALEKTPRGVGQARRQRGDPGRDRARRGAARFGARLSARYSRRDLRRADPVVPIDIPQRARVRLAGRNAITAPSRSPTNLQRPPGSTRSSPAAPSSAASATSTPSRSRSSRATRITRPSARSCSATRPPFFCSPEQAAERSCVLRDATFCHPAR